MLADVSQINDFYSKQFKTHQTIASRLLYTLAVGVKVQDIREAWLVTRGSWGHNPDMSWTTNDCMLWQCLGKKDSHRSAPLKSEVDEWCQTVKPATHPRMPCKPTGRIRFFLRVQIDVCAILAINSDRIQSVSREDGWSRRMDADWTERRWCGFRLLALEHWRTSMSRTLAEGPEKNGPGIIGECLVNEMNDAHTGCFRKWILNDPKKIVVRGCQWWKLYHTNYLGNVGTKMTLSKQSSRDCNGPSSFHPKHTKIFIDALKSTKCFATLTTRVLQPLCPTFVSLSCWKSANPLAAVVAPTNATERSVCNVRAARSKGLPHIDGIARIQWWQRFLFSFLKGSRKAP